MAFKRVGKSVQTEPLELPLPDALYPLERAGKWGYINHRLEVVIPFQYEDAQDFREGRAPVSEVVTNAAGQMKELYGFIDANNNRVVNCRYAKVYPFSEGRAGVMKDHKFGFIDTNGVEVIALQFEEIAMFSEGKAAVKLRGRTGFIDRSGKMIITPKFERACWVSSFAEGLAPVYLDDEKGGFIDSAGEFCIEPKFGYVSAFSENLALVRPIGCNHFGFINRQGEYVIEPIYDSGLPFCEGVATVKLTRNGHSFYRIIDKKGQVLADYLQYAFVGILKEGLAGFETYDNRWGFLEKNGKVVIPAKFSSVRLFNNDLSKVETGSLFGGLTTNYIDKSGKLVLKQ